MTKEEFTHEYVERCHKQGTFTDFTIYFADREWEALKNGRATQFAQEIWDNLSHKNKVVVDTVETITPLQF